MKKIIFSIVFCFAFTLLGENSHVMEVFPKPVDGKVASEQVIVKGYVKSDIRINALRIEISGAGEPTRYINQPELAVYPEGNETGSSFSYFYYVENIPVSSSGITITVRKSTAPGSWDLLDANDSGLEISYLPITDSPTSEYAESMWGRIANESVEGEPMRGIFYFGGPDNKFYRGIYSRIPQNLPKYLWKTYDDVELLFDEMKEAGVNTIKMSYWGDWEKNDPLYKEVEYSDGTIVKDRLWMLGDPGFYKLCDFEIRQFTDKCYELVETESSQAVNTHEMRICDTCSLSECTERATSLNKLNRWREQTQTNRAPYCEQLCVDYEEIPGSCWYISVPKKDGSFWDATIDSREVVFQMALLKDMTVVPVIEDANANFRFSPYFPDKSYILKNRIKKLLEKYGDYESWLEMYDKNGERRKAVFLLQSIYYGNSIPENLEAEFDKIANEIYLETKCKHKIGFILDTSPLAPTYNDMGTGVPFHNYDDPEGNTYIPQPEKLRKADSFLAINPFNITSDTGLSDVCNFQDDLWSDDAIRLCNSDRWLKYWYEESGLPLIATVVPGFDDRPSRLGYQFYGDSDLWNHIMEKSVRQYNTAGITLDIWNGFTEGYVFVPMVSFFNKWNVTRTGNENYEFAKTLFWKGKNNIYYTDEDNDGVIDSFDNCPNLYNPPVEVDYNTELVMSMDGSISKGFGFATAEFLFNIGDIPVYKYSYFMQPDSDLDGIGDACDYASSGTVAETPEKLGFASSRIINTQSHSFTINHLFQEFDDYVLIGLNMPENSGKDLDFCEQGDENGIECNAAVHYCAVSSRFSHLWGTRGNCSTSVMEGGSYMENIGRFGYSHGSDDFSEDSILSWQSRISVADLSKFTKSRYWKESFTEATLNMSPARKPVKASTSGESVIWNWRKDWYESNFCSENPETSLCQSLVNGGSYDAENTMHYALSTSILPVKAGENLEKIPSYTKYGENGKLKINDAYFPPTNTNKFARATRYNIEPMELNYHTKVLTVPDFDQTELPNIDLCLSCYFDVPVRFLGINGIVPYDYISRYILRKQPGNSVALQSQRIVYPENLVIFNEISPEKMFSVVRDGNDYFLALNTSNSGADWNRLGELENWDDNLVSTSQVAASSANFFIAERKDQTKHLYAFESAGEIPQVSGDLSELPELTYTLTDLGVVPVSGNTIKLLYTDGRLYLLEQSSTDFKMYSFNGTDFVEIKGVMPPQRNILNVAATGKYLFLAGGTDLNNDGLSDLWRFDTETESWTQIPVMLQGDFSKVIMQEVDGRIIGFNPVIDDNTTFPVFEFENLERVENIEVSYSTIKIDNHDFDQTFCINETSNSIFPGITNVYGECVKAENYNFDEITFPDYKLSVAGYRNSLYLGGLTGIRRLEIGENGEATKKEMIYSGESNNLAVYGNTLYAANYSEIDIFKIADTGKIERKSSVKTNSCQNIRIENVKLFAAENKRVRIFDLNDPLSPEPVKTISLTNSVEDLEVTENRLFVYENLNKLLTRKGKVSVFDISNITTPQKIKEFSQYCNDPEMQKSGNRVYLGCKNGSFKITDSSLQKVNGEKNYLREGYVFDGILYQVFSGTLHKSEAGAAETGEDGWM